RFDAAAEEAGLAVLLSFAWIARPAGAGHATLGVTLGVDDVAAFALFADFVVAEHVAGARRQAPAPRGRGAVDEDAGAAADGAVGARVRFGAADPAALSAAFARAEAGESGRAVHRRLA